MTRNAASKAFSNAEMLSAREHAPAPITNPSHRPLQSQVAGLLAERVALFEEQDTLRTENSALRTQLQEAHERIHHLEQRQDIVADGHGLEEECRALQEACELFSARAVSADAEAKEAKARLATCEARCSKLLSDYMQASSGQHSERSAHDDCKSARRVEVATLCAELEGHDAEVAQRDLLLLSALGETQWLRGKLSHALRKQHKAVLALRAEQQEHAEQSQARAAESARLEHELQVASDERSALAASLQSEQGVHKRLQEELESERHQVAALKRRVEDADEARVDALVYADRADHALIHEQAGAERASALQDALRAHFDVAATVLARSAVAIERMRFTHSTEQRHTLVERAWADISKQGAGFEGLPPELPWATSFGPDGGEGAQAQGAIAHRSSSDVALAASANAFMRSALALAASAANGPADDYARQRVASDASGASCSGASYHTPALRGGVDDGVHGSLALLAWPAERDQRSVTPTWSHGERRRLEMDVGSTPRP